MREIIHAFDVDAAPAEVYRGLTTGEGLAGWWTTSVRIEGDRIRFTFEGPMNPTMRVTEAAEPRTVAWALEDGFPPWEGSTFRFDLEEREGKTGVLFRHLYGHDLPDRDFGFFNFNWGYYLESLRLLCEEGTGKPFRAAA